jgi:hypothetical protein
MFYKPNPSGVEPESSTFQIRKPTFRSDYEPFHPLLILVGYSQNLKFNVTILSRFPKWTSSKRFPFPLKKSVPNPCFLAD